MVITTYKLYISDFAGFGGTGHHTPNGRSVGQRAGREGCVVPPLLGGRGGSGRVARMAVIGRERTLIPANA